MGEWPRTTPTRRAFRRATNQARDAISGPTKDFCEPAKHRSNLGDIVLTPTIVAISSHLCAVQWHSRCTCCSLPARKFVVAPRQSCRAYGTFYVVELMNRSMQATE